MKEPLPRTLVIGAAILLALPGTALAVKNSKDIKMTFEVEDGALKLKKGFLYTTPSNCQNGNHDGCYEIDKTEYGAFRLTLKKGDADCDDDDAWKWHSVTLGGEGKLDSPEPKPAAWGNISSDAAKDFDADETTGVVNTTLDGKKRIEFTDQNESEYSIWYKVAVESCADSNEILEYDPRIDNKG